MSGTHSLSRLVFLSALIAVLPLTASAQFYGGGGGGFYGGGGGGFYGGGGFGGPGGFGGGGAAGPGVVIAKYGEKVYDAVFGDLIDYKVYYIPIPADQVGVNYFDDGTNGDEVPYDGMPSLIYINDDTYLGPFSIKYKNWLEKAIEKADEMGALEFYDLGAVSTEDDSRVPFVGDWKEQLQNNLEELQIALTQFEGYDSERYIKSIDPSLFEQLEGFGAQGGGLGAAGILPDLPPPPGLPQPGDELQRIRDSIGGNAGGAGQTDTEQTTGRFDPVGRALNAAEAANTLNQ